MRVHDRLGAPARAGRVHPQCRILGVHRLRRTRRALRQGGAPAVERHQLRAPRRGRVVAAVGEDEAKAGRVEDRAPLDRRDPRVDAHRDAAGPDHAEVGDDPVDAVGQLNRDALAALQAARAPGRTRARDEVA